MIDDDLEKVDRLALGRAIALTLEGDDRPAAEQVQCLLMERGWFEVATFCAYHWQFRSLHLKPWEPTPCWIEPDQIDALIRRGPDNREYAAAKLLKRMLRLGLSQFDPTPLESIGQA